jgi:hypothetical protein
MASLKDVLSDLQALKDWGHALRKTCARRNLDLDKTALLTFRRRQEGRHRRPRNPYRRL